MLSKSCIRYDFDAPEKSTSLLTMHCIYVACLYLWVGAWDVLEADVHGFATRA